MAAHTESVKTDDGYHLTRYAVVGEVGILRRDDLRGCWEVAGVIYGDRSEAFAAAEKYLDNTTEEPPPTL